MSRPRPVRHWIVAPSRGLLCALGLAAATIAAAAPDPAPVPKGRQLHGVDLAPFTEVAAWSTHLRLAGASVVDHHYMPFQVVALYLGAETPDGAMLAAGLARCRIEVHWLGPALAAADARAWWDAALARSVPEAPARARLASAWTRLAERIGAPARGAVTRLDYDPDAGLAVTHGDGAPMRLAGLELSRAVLGVWLGTPAARAELLGQPAAATQ
jgi:hypothetical protein